MSQLPFDSSGVFVDGVWRAGASGETLPLINPSDGSAAGADRARRARPTSTPPWPPRRPRSTAPGAR